MPTSSESRYSRRRSSQRRRKPKAAWPLRADQRQVHGELDPADPKNALITDIQLAPRNARGKVEYVGTFSLMKPVDMAKASGVLMYSVVNRGNGAAAASAEGHISLVSGWQGDVVPTATNQTIQVPRAKNPDGSSITGPLWSCGSLDQRGTTRRLMIPRGTPVSVSAGDARHRRRHARLRPSRERRRASRPASVTIPSTDWAFANCESTPFPGTPGSGAHLPEERFRSGAALRTAVHRRRIRSCSASGSRPRAISIRSSATRRAGRRGNAESGGGHGALGDLGGQLAVRHVPARVHPARVQPGRDRAHRVGRQQSEHRGARDRPESAIRAAGRRR